MLINFWRPWRSQKGFHTNWEAAWIDQPAIPSHKLLPHRFLSWKTAQTSAHAAKHVNLLLCTISVETESQNVSSCKSCWPTSAENLPSKGSQEDIKWIPVWHSPSLLHHSCLFKESSCVKSEWGRLQTLSASMSKYYLLGYFYFSSTQVRTGSRQWEQLLLIHTQSSLQHCAHNPCFCSLPF